MMSRPFVRPALAAILMCLPLSTPNAEPLDPTDDLAQLRELKLVQWPKAYREQDVALLARLLDDRFQMTDGRGAVSTKADELAWVRDHRPGYDSFQFEIERLEVFEGDSAIASGLGTVRGTRDGAPYVTRYRSTNVFVKRDGAWRAVASHVSTVPEGP